MRKRRVRRPPAGHEEMWFTMPGAGAPAAEAASVADTPKRQEEPTYEDPWYQVLRRRLGERSSAD